MKRSLTAEEFSKLSEILELGLKVEMGDRTWTVVQIDTARGRIVVEN